MKKKRAICPVCKRERALSNNGRFHYHSDTSNIPGHYCHGSSKYPVGVYPTTAGSREWRFVFKPKETVPPHIYAQHVAVRKKRAEKWLSRTRRVRPTDR